jgi:hypothetical protein
MPKYFFHVHNVAPNADQEGEELPDDEAAWREATSYAGALLNDIDEKVPAWRRVVARGN